jgi:hypothetical protein
MLDNVRILNFDASIASQQQLASRYYPQIIDLLDIGPSVRLWMDIPARDEIAKRLGGPKRNSLTFIGSGDFHHISSILTGQLQEPACLIVFDFHPDWDTLPPRLGCGSWVTAALNNNNILKCLLLGASSDDISSGWCLQNANLRSLKDNRVEIYPYAHKPSQVFFRGVPGNISLKSKKNLFRTRIYWNELKNYNLEGFFASLIRRLPVKRVYVSIDKDCLKKEYALTNWEEGLLSLDELLSMLRIIRENLDIAAADVTGDYSEPIISGRWKKFLSGLDHPADIPAKKYSAEQIIALNQETNLRILETLL